MFLPPFCPYGPCPYHREPLPGFYRRIGSYQPLCRSHPVPRFRCRACGRSFSRQTFRADYRMKKPHLNAPFLQLMVSCVGQRQAARCLRVARRTIEHRFRWLARHAFRYHTRRLEGALLRGPFQLDELESFEANRYQPVTVPVLIHRKTFFLVAATAGPLRRKGRLTRRQRHKRAEYEVLHGKRPSHASSTVRRVLLPLLALTPLDTPLVLDSDRKPLYGRLGLELFGDRFHWRAHSASARRDRANPLFPINHTNARLRHYLSRLRRRTWCVSKRRASLEEHIAIAMLWGNYCRGITNRTATTPAQALGLAPRPYRVEEVLGWREDWDGNNSLTGAAA